MWFQFHSGKQSPFSLVFFSCYFRKLMGYARGLSARNGVSIGYDVSAVWPDCASVFSLSWKFASRLRVCCDGEKYDWAGIMLERRPKAWNSGSRVWSLFSFTIKNTTREAHHGVVDLTSIKLPYIRTSDRRTSVHQNRLQSSFFKRQSCTVCVVWTVLLILFIIYLNRLVRQQVELQSNSVWNLVWNLWPTHLSH